MQTSSLRVNFVPKNLCSRRTTVKDVGKHPVCCILANQVPILSEGWGTRCPIGNRTRGTPPTRGLLLKILDFHLVLWYFVHKFTIGVIATEAERRWRCDEFPAKLWTVFYPTAFQRSHRVPHLRNSVSRLAGNLDSRTWRCYQISMKYRGNDSLSASVRLRLVIGCNGISGDNFKSS